MHPHNILPVLLPRASLQRGLLSGGGFVLVSPDSYDHDVHTLANLMKIYLRELPDALLTCALYCDWLTTYGIVEHEERLFAIKRMLGQLPQANVDTLAFLARFLSSISEHEAVNKMTVRNLSVVIGPNLLWSNHEETGGMGADVQGMTLAQVCSRSYMFITSLIFAYMFLFS